MAKVPWRSAVQCRKTGTGTAGMAEVPWRSGMQWR